MGIKLIDYAIENEDSTSCTADITIEVDGIKVRWHITPDKWDTASRWVTFSAGIGAPGDDYDLSDLSADDRSFLFGERFDNEEIHDFESRVESALEKEMAAIRWALRDMMLDALDLEYAASREERGLDN